MKKVILLLSAVLLSAATLTAQKYHIEKSAEFDEPDYGWNKILQLKNGNTFFSHAENKEGIDVVVYDKNRKVISKKTITGRLWDIDQLKSSTILGLYEISGEPVIFLVQYDDRQPTLYRIRLNPSNGALVKEDELGKLPKVTMGKAYAMVFGGVDPSQIVVEKDPNSDCYAVVFFNGFAHDRNERIRVCHYDGSHKKINEAYYESPDNAFKYLRYIGSTVDGDKRLYITTYAYNGRSGGDAANRVIVSKLSVGDSSFKHKLLNFTEDFDKTQSVMLYNHNNNKIQLLTLSFEETKHRMFSSRSTSSYSTLLSYIDPETLEVTSVKPINAEKVVDYAHNKIDKDYDYNGLPQQMILNKDNTTTILIEDVTTEVVRNSRGMVVSQNTLLGPVGISELSDTGAELSGYAINKKQQVKGLLPLLYLSGRSKGVYQNASYVGIVKGDINQFMSFDYINAPKGRYVIFNDLPSNSDKDEDETKRKTVTKISATNTICYKLDGDKIEKSFLFGEPDAKESSFSYIESSDFNKDNSTYATMLVERDGRDKEVRIAWVTFE